MARIRGRDTAPEALLRRALWRSGERGYRLQRRIQRASPDIVIPRAKLAVYVDGCYWHGCEAHGTTPKSNGQAWKDKFAANRSRDADTDARLVEAGWTVMRFWEHEDPVESAAKVLAAVRGQPTGRR